ncbi:MAG: alpha/beta hydrolase family protein [Phycisphaerales bacterium]
MSEYPTVDDRFKQLPKSLQAKSKHTTLAGDVPALLVHPDFQTPSPWVLWIHGRTVYKELDPGRYNRWVRAGIGAVAIDLPGHGERFTPGAQDPSQTIHTITQCIDEINPILQSIRELGIFDMGNAGIGGMSAGGMVALRSLCNPNPFIGASVECTSGDLMGLYFPQNRTADGPWRVHHDQEQVRAVDTKTHLQDLNPLPIMIMHNRGDEVVPYQLQSDFADTLRSHYRDHDADPGLIQCTEFENTGAIQEHSGFGKFASKAKDLQLEFLKNLFNIPSN